MRYHEIYEGLYDDQTKYSISVYYKNTPTEVGNQGETFWSDDPYDLSGPKELGKSKTITKVETYQMLNKPVNGVNAELYVTSDPNRFNRDGFYTGRNVANVEYGPFESPESIPDECMSQSCWQVQGGRIVQKIR